jgi:hypothetical protein
MIQISNSNIKNIADSYANKIVTICHKRGDFINTVVNFIRNGNLQKLKNHSLNDAAKVAILFLFFREKKTAKTAYVGLTVSKQRSEMRAHLPLIKRVASYFNDPTNLKEVIICEPIDLMNMHEVIYNHLAVSDAERSIVNKILIEIFDYGEFSDFAYDLAGDIGVHCCPYCNRGFIKEVKIRRKNGKSGIRPTFDHFLSKSDFPMFALSFYNLIPSCYHCNSSLKHTAQTSCDTHLHPYIDGFGKDVRFSAKLIDLNKNLSDPSNIKVEIKSYGTLTTEKKRQIFGGSNDEGNINLFGLDEIYQMHRDVAGELIMRTQRFNSAYAATLQSMFGDLKTNKEEFYRFYFGSYLNENDFHKRPLAKMTRDIVSQELPSEFDYI